MKNWIKSLNRSISTNLQNPEHPMPPLNVWTQDFCFWGQICRQYERNCCTHPLWIQLGQGRGLPVLLYTFIFSALSLQLCPAKLSCHVVSRISVLGVRRCPRVSARPGYPIHTHQESFWKLTWPHDTIPFCGTLNKKLWLPMIYFITIIFQMVSELLGLYFLEQIYLRVGLF